MARRTIEAMARTERERIVAQWNGIVSTVPDYSVTLPYASGHDQQRGETFARFSIAQALAQGYKMVGTVPSGLDCAYCGASMLGAYLTDREGESSSYPTRDHLVPQEVFIAYGTRTLTLRDGTRIRANGIENILIACRTCNTVRGNELFHKWISRCRTTSKVVLEVRNRMIANNETLTQWNGQDFENVRRVNLGHEVKTVLDGRRKVAAA